MDIFEIGALPAALKAPPSRPEDGRKVTSWADIDLSKPLCVRSPGHHRLVTFTYRPQNGSLEGQRSIIEANLMGARLNPKIVLWQAKEDT